MDNVKQTILSMKYARIIQLLSIHFDGDVEKAIDVFYNSQMLQLIQDNIADLHCRSDEYLADEIFYEYLENNTQDK